MSYVYNDQSLCFKCNFFQSLKHNFLFLFIFIIYFYFSIFLLRYFLYIIYTN